MPSLDAVRKKFPDASTVAGRVVALHKGVHLDLGQYVGDGMVILSVEAEQLMTTDKPAKKSESKAESEKESKPAPKPDPDSGGVDVSDFS